MTVAADREQIDGLFARIERIEKVAGTLASDDQRRAELLDVVHDALDSCPAVRPVIASEVLHVSEPTVQAWMKRGILAVVVQNKLRGSLIDALPNKRWASPRQLLDPHRLHEVWHILQDLRTAKQTRGLTDAVWHRLQDQELLEHPDLAESLEQMRTGAGVDVDADELRASVLRGSSSG